MAMCTHRVLDLVGVDDPGRAAGGGAVRVADTAGADLTVTAYGINTHSLCFEAACKYATIVTHGRLELRS